MSDDPLPPRARDTLPADTTRLADRPRDSSAAVEETRSRLEQLLAASPLALFTFRATPNYEVTFTSDNIQQLTGYSVEQVRNGEFFLGCVHRQDRSLFESRLGNLLGTGSNSMEYRLRRADGQYRWVREDLRLIRGADGAPIEAVGSWLDITDRRLVEQTLAAQVVATRVLAHAQTLKEATPTIVQAACEIAGWEAGAVWVVDSRTRTLACLDAWRIPELDLSRIIHVTENARFSRGVGLPGRVWASGVPEWSANLAAEAGDTRSAAASHDGIHGVFAVPITSTGAFAADPEGTVQPNAVVGVIEFYSCESRPPDSHITGLLTSLGSQIGQFLERRQSEDALRMSEERTRLVIDAALDAVISIDAGGIVRVWNAQAERIFGWTRDEALDRRFIDLVVPPRFRDRFAGGIQRYLDTGEGLWLSRRIRVTVFDRSGREFPVEVSISPVSRWRPRGTDAGSVRSRGRAAALPVLFSLFVRDISAQLEVERDRRRARQAAEAATRAKSEFLATMSHEIRTPMNAIIGMTGLLLDSDLSPRQRDYAETVHNSAQGLLGIINDVLDFSRIEAGRLELEDLVFSPADVVEDVAELLADSAQRKGIELSTFVDRSVPVAASGDPGRLRQILTNIVGNAVKFTERGEVVVRVTGKPQPGTAGDVGLRFAVSDTGPGIESGVLERLFLPFSQADSSMSRRYGGTGLGLAISRRLANLMNGSIEAQSEPGRGSTFVVSVVMRAVAGDPREDLPAAPRTLVLDPHDGVRSALVEQLAAWGVPAQGAPDVVAALDASNRARESGQPLQLFLASSNQPDLAGAAAVLRADARGQARCLILMVPMAWPDLRSVRDLGYDDSVTRPLRRSRIRGCLRRLLVQASAGTAPAPAAPSHWPAFRGRALVAEDNPTNQMVAVAQLTRLGFRADAVANGIEAVKAMEQLPYDIVLMDCQMPEMDGYAASIEIRRHEQTGRHVPIVAMTANVQPGERKRCLQSGMDDYLPKPVNRAMLADVLERWVPVTAVPVDLDAIQRSREVMGDGWRELRDTYLQSSSEAIEALSEAVDAQRLSDVVALAHRLRGGSGVFGAMRIVSLCATLEEQAHHGEAERSSTVVLEIREEFASLRASLASME